jgi:hypothetical protein
MNAAVMNNDAQRAANSTSPVGMGEVKTRSGEGEGDRVGTLHSSRRQNAARRPDHPHPRRKGASTAPISWERFS